MTTGEKHPRENGAGRRDAGSGSRDGGRGDDVGDVGGGTDTGTGADDGGGGGDDGRLLVRTFEPDDEPAVIALWHACGLTRPWNDPRRDIARRRAIDDGLFLVGTLVRGGPARLVASAMGGYEGHRGWVNYLGVDPAHRGHGHARAMMAALESRLLARGCPKINLQVREENAAALAFYERLGYAVDRSVSLGKRLIPDD